MKVSELVKISRRLLELMSKHGLHHNDWRHLDMYEEYMEMVEKGLKKCYIVAYLSEKYKVCERKVYYLVKKFEQDCTFGAA